ncbi:MAG: translation initiation factor IF-3 [Oscillospiraceae bacterium]|nr:translation initiation factor IF-3 [Oscillospiraceae bacterium]
MSGVRPHHRIANGASRSIGSRFFAGFLRADAEGVRFFSFWRCFTIANVNYEINEEILDKELRIISDTGEQLGIMSAEEALKIAEERELDLVKISPAAKPPVCKIMDYGKFRFEQAKREKEAKKNQRVMEVKEVRMSPNIDANDFNTKLKNAQKFLNDGDRVKVSIRFRGREMAHTHIGETLLRDFAAKCGEIANLDKEPKLEGRNMSMFLSPKSAAAIKKAQKEAEKKAAEAQAAESEKE